MSTGLILFLVFMALSILDSVARARRSRQATLPPEDGEESPDGASPDSAEKTKPAEKELPWGLGEGLDLEELMGPAFAGAMEEASTPPPSAEPDATLAAARGAEPVSSGVRDERMRGERIRGVPGRDRRRSEGPGRSSRAERQLSERSPRAQRPLPERPGRRPPAAARESVRLQDSDISRERRRPVPPLSASVPVVEGRSPSRTRLYRELFGAGGRDSVRRAFVLKEILDAPVSERPERREAR